jgi:broad specificity phosphatase PhoE
MKIILCRHGETKWTLEGKHTSFTDIPITANGEDQARALSSKLKNVSFDEVYSSPLQRALKTAELTNLKQQVNIEPLAMEWNYGDYEGLTTPEIRKQAPHWNLFFDGAPGGESPKQMAKRADSLIEKWIDHNKTILLFSHGHFLRSLACRWIGLGIENGRLLGLSVGSISILGYEREQRIIEKWNSN